MATYRSYKEKEQGRKCIIARSLKGRSGKLHNFWRRGKAMWRERESEEHLQEKGPVFFCKERPMVD